MAGPLVVPISLGVGKILGDLFGNLFGAGKQASAAKEAAQIQSRTALDLARMEREAMDQQLAYLKGIDERDYADWLAREARDRTDWENKERRRAPYRALSDSAVRTLADYIRVPGMRPAQEVPVQQWTHQPQQPPVNTTMPVGGDLRVYAQPQPGAFVSPQRPPRRTLADFAG